MHRTLLCVLLCLTTLQGALAFLPAREGEVRGLILGTLNAPAPAGKDIASKTLPSLKLVRIPAEKKKFTMGSPEDEEGRFDDETEHQVTLSKDYYLGVTTVTRGQFAAFVKGADYKTEPEKAGKTTTWLNPGFEQTDDHPVVEVSWNDAVAFCKWLSAEDNRAYYLPTEAQWEFACRAGTKTAFSFGDAKSLGEYAWFGENVKGATHAVGKKKPNPLGLYDMQGNVWQWCADVNSKYPKGAVTDPQGPEATAESLRVIRGGSWFGIARRCRSANRGDYDPAGRDDTIGFRLSAPVQ